MRNKASRINSKTKDIIFLKGEPERVFALCKYQAIAVEEDEI